MNDPMYDIVSYSEDYAGRLLQFERGIVQGKKIQLEIIKEHFLDRAAVFENFHALLALSVAQEPVGTMIGAQTVMEINGEQRQVGFGFDAKIAPHWRNQGMGRHLARELYQRFFTPLDLKANFMTAKLSNIPVRRLVSGLLSKVWLYDFVYLTIPSSARLKCAVMPSQPGTDFSVNLFDREKLSPAYYTGMDDGLGYIHSFQLYRLKIKKIHPAYKLGIGLFKKLYVSKYRDIPEEGEILSFVTLYGHTPGNIGSINTILEDVERKGIRQLLVCCRKGDHIYRALKNIAINCYSYCLVTDFRISNNDRINIDIRCL